MSDSPEEETADFSAESQSSEKRLLSPTSKINLIILCILFLIFCGVMLTEYLKHIVLMLAASLILTYILLEPVGFIESCLHKIQLLHRRVSAKLVRALAILVVYLLFFGLMGLTVFRVVPPLALQVKEFAKDLPIYLAQLNSSPLGQIQPSTQTSAPFAALVTDSWEETQKSRANDTTITTETRVSVTHKQPPKTRILKATYLLALERLALNYKQVASKLGSLLLGWSASTLSGLIYILTTLVLVFYLLHDGNELKIGVVDLIPSRNEAAVDKFLSRLHLQFHSIIRGQVLLSFLAGGVIYLLLLFMGIKYALLLGVFFGLASILPVIGPWIGLIPIMGILAFSSHPIDILQIFLITGIFYLVKAYWIWPKLVHRKYDVHPILFILTFVACLKLAGLLGLLLSFPLATTLGVLTHTIKSIQAAKSRIILE